MSPVLAQRRSSAAVGIDTMNAFRKKNRDVDFSETVDRLMGDVKTLVAPTTLAPAQP